MIQPGRLETGARSCEWWHVSHCVQRRCVQRNERSVCTLLLYLADRSLRYSNDL